MDCPNCGRHVPAGAYCVRCGEPLSPSQPDDRGRHPRRRGFAAAPHEDHRVPHLVSTLFPHLPHAGMASFRIALLGGTAVVVGLALAGLFPLALVVTAVVIPLLAVLYMWDVDLYEDEPLRVIGLTLGAGALLGIALGAVDGVVSSPLRLLGGVSRHTVVWQGALLPLITVAFMLAGPLVALPYRKFNDVLDGTTFGVVSAVAVAGAEVVTRSRDLLSQGLRPGGLVTPWVIDLLELGVALPVLYASAVGAASGSLWLRYRAPRRDREALGLLGRPVVALVLAFCLSVSAGLVEVYWHEWLALALIASLAAVGLVWLRRVIHLGLGEEAAEISVGEPVACANCGLETPRHTFCSNCGVALRALPKSSAARTLVEART